MEKELKILFLEDQLFDYELIIQELNNSRIKYSSKLVSDEKSFEDAIKSFKPDLILSDYSLPQYDGMSALLHTLKTIPEIPFIVVTGSINEEVAVDCIKAGATDYVTKKHLPRLSHAIKGALKQAEISKQKKRAEETKEILIKISELSETSDSLEVLSKIIHKELGRIIDNTNFYIALYNEEDNTYSFPFYKDKYKIITPEEVFNLKDSITDYVRREGKAIITTQDKEDGLKSQKLVSVGKPSAVWIGAPLIDTTSDKIIGIVAAQNYEDQNALTEADVEILEFVARTIGRLIARKRVEISMTESEEQFRSLAQTASDAIIIINDKGKIIFWNKAASSIFQYDNKEVIGQDLHKIIAPSQYHDVIDKGLSNFEETGKGSVFEQSLELIGKRKDESVFPAELSISKFQRGGKWHSTGFIRDITKRKTAEFELKKALEKAEESDRLKTAFLANMSHEIRTPMNAILGFSELLTLTDLSIEERDEFIKLIQNNSNSLLNLINDIIDIAKIEAEQLQIHIGDFSLNKLISDILKTFNEVKISQNKTDIDINKHIPENNNDLIIRSDQNRIIQVISNLLNNALKYTIKGSIDFGYEILESKKEPQIKFFVKDTGIGIPKDKIDVIFERFRQGDGSHTREYGGTGLGLAISQNIAKLLGGEIIVESKEGKGSVFYFTIPLNKSELVLKKEYTPSKSSKGSLNLKGINILIVEDVESNYQLLETYLAKTNANVIWKKNGKEAIEECETNDQIDIILMDMQMPVMNGFEATKIIKRMQPELPIIAETAFALAGDKEKILTAGCIDYISKPIKAGDLYDKIEKYIKK